MTEEEKIKNTVDIINNFGLEKLKNAAAQSRKPTERYCPLSWSGHTFTQPACLWLNPHPTCNCGYKDTSRILED